MMLKFIMFYILMGLAIALLVHELCVQNKRYAIHYYTKPARFVALGCIAAFWPISLAFMLYDKYFGRN